MLTSVTVPLMDPAQTGRQYDAIASWWLDQMTGSTYGVAALERALQFVGPGRRALDVGCGCEGRYLRILLERGVLCTGVDVSREMIALAATRHPTVRFELADIAAWTLPHQYDLITAWDSTFHLPLQAQEPVLEKLCTGLTKQGVLLFTCGDTNEPGTVQGGFGGRRFEYSSLGVREYVRLLWRFDCTVRHIEYDQMPADHVYLIARKN
ncbi:MAG TPA: class I SAM-dependent methyltransferase [Nitrospira sp.]|nr:class I SAM-dependent methyltransferase [Nitrospira sp.]